MEKMLVSGQNIKSFLQENGFKVQSAGGEYQIVARWREGKNPNVSINPKTGKWIDYVTGTGGEWPALVGLIGGELTLETQNFQPQSEEIEIPQVFDSGILSNLKQNHEYWEGRKINPEICEYFQGGAADFNLPKMKNRYVFPIFNEKKQICGLSGRALGDAPAKWKHLGTKKTWIWPRGNNIKETSRAILVESVGCILSLWYAGIRDCLCIFGIKLSPAVLNYLISLNTSKIIVATNYEPENNNIGNRAAKEISEKLSKFFDNVEVRIPSPYKDVNDMLIIKGKEKVKEIYGS